VGEFGNKFRKAREKKNFSLDDVSNVTKIGSRMLQAIEEERFDQLPGGVFNKGFIRAYAKHLGLNDEDAVTDYLACLRQAQIDAHEVWEPQPAAQTRARAPERPRPVQPNRPAPTPIRAAEKAQPPAQSEELPELQLPRAEDVRPRRKEFIGQSESAIPWRMLAVAAVVIVVAVVLWTRRSHRTNAATAVAAPTQAAPIAAPAPAVNKTASAPPAGRTATVTHPPTSNPQSSLRPASSAATHPAALASVSSPAAAVPGNGNEHNNNAAAVQTLPKVNPLSSEKSATPLTLMIRATETSWISVLADGQTVSQETLIAPANTSVRANREIVAKIGNAAGVTFLFNGQEIPADGAEAEVKTFIFDSNGMRVAAASPPPAQ
jgi:cytoskeletal protein RodZ